MRVNDDSIIIKLGGIVDNKALDRCHESVKLRAIRGFIGQLNGCLTCCSGVLIIDLETISAYNPVLIENFLCQYVTSKGGVVI